MKKMRLFVVVLLVAFMLGVPERVEAATASQVKSCTKELLEMLYTADLSRHDISRYRITKTEFLDILEEVRYGEGAEIEGAYFPSMSINYSSSGGYVKAMWLLDINGDAVERYNRMQPIIESILAGIEADMTDLDKLIYLHGEVVDWVTYQQTTEAMYTASGAFIDKKAVCAGYAKALNILLHRVGIDATYVKGTSLNHGWSYVELDGQWYHVDPTWDDTRASAKGQISRKDLLRNDAEFSKDHGVWTVKRIDEVSSSTLYKDWFVHDIVGEMSFEDGLWYYLDTKNKTVVAADVKNRKQEVVFSYSTLGNVTLVDAVDDQLILKVNGKEISKTVEQWKGDSDLDIKVEVNNKEDILLGGTTGYTMDLTDLSLWRTGQYDMYTGAYVSHANRICLNKLVANVHGQYVVTISEDDYRIVFRELDESGKLIQSVRLGNGDVYIPSKGTEFLAVTVYNGVREGNVTFATYEKLFANGFVIGLNLELGEDVQEDTKGEAKEEVEDTTEEEDVIGGIEGEVDDFLGGAEDIIEGTEDGVNGTEEKNELTTVFEIAFNDLSNWRIGQYDINTGAYVLHANRICLNKLIVNAHDRYVVTISESDYRIVIRELDESKKLIQSVRLGNGDVYIPSKGTEYLAVTVYNGVREWDVTFATYEKLFANGFVIGLNPKAEEDVQEDATGEYSDLTTIALNDLSNWRTGQYDINTGAYVSHANRICLNKLVANVHDRYVVTISDGNYRIVIRELDGSKKLIQSVRLENGDVYIPSKGTEYLAVTVYNGVREWDVTFATYEKLFANGFVIGLNLKAEEDVQEETTGEYSDLTTIALNDLSNWKTGQYDINTGAYVSHANRICLNKLVANVHDRYVVTISDGNYRIVIRELDGSKKLIQSVRLGNGDVYIPSKGTEYLAVTVYNGVREWDVTFATYQKLFAQGFEVGFCVK